MVSTPGWTPGWKCFVAANAGCGIWQAGVGGEKVELLVGVLSGVEGEVNCVSVTQTALFVFSRWGRLEQFGRALQLPLSGSLCAPPYVVGPGIHCWWLESVVF